jgi:hypothetical protein
MANGHVIEEIRSLAADENVVIPQKAYNRLMLSAIVELHDIIKPMAGWGQTIKIIRWLGVVMGGAILMLLLSMLTHTFSWPF